MKLALTFTNLGPYHLARLRALGERLEARGWSLLVYETAESERRYPWEAGRRREPFQRETLVTGQALEDIPARVCVRAIDESLERDRPDAVGIVGYVRPECLATLRWAERCRRPVVLLSESQHIDKRRVWWKEAIKSRRVRRCASALVGGPRHRSYLTALGMPEERIALGYNAVDNVGLASRAEIARQRDRHDLAVSGPFLLAVSRLVPEKNLAMLIRAFAQVREKGRFRGVWSLVICGDGPERRALGALVERAGLQGLVHFPGFLQEADLVQYYAFASAFVHPSRSEPWGLVVNEAAACGLPLVVSDRAGCAETLVPDPVGTTGRRIDPANEDDLAEAIAWVASLAEAEREAMGLRAREIVGRWGPDRFAQGMFDALAMASGRTAETWSGRLPVAQRAARVP
jgi:glycosyltransferase involved in cell wall biosynthesis